MGYHQETMAMRQANNNVTVFFFQRVVGVRNSGTERITEDRRSFAERDLVFAEVLRFLFWVPLKFHTASVAVLPSFANPAISY